MLNCWLINTPHATNDTFKEIFYSLAYIFYGENYVLISVTACGHYENRRFQFPYVLGKRHSQGIDTYWVTLQG